MMDVVIADVLPLMACGRHWGTPVGGSIQFDLSYAAMPIFGGYICRLFREPKMTYTLSLVTLKIHLTFLPTVQMTLGISFSIMSQPCRWVLK